MVFQSKTDDSDRAQLVEVLWNLKQGFRKYGTGSLRLTVVQFNWLLNDPDYRESVIRRAESSGIEALQLIAAHARLLNRPGRLIASDRYKEPVLHAGEALEEPATTQHAHSRSSAPSPASKMILEHAYAANIGASSLLMRRGQPVLMSFPKAHKLSTGISLDLHNQTFTLHRAGCYLVRYGLSVFSNHPQARLSAALTVNNLAVTAASLPESPVSFYNHLTLELIQEFEAGSRVNLSLCAAGYADQSLASLLRFSNANAEPSPESFELSLASCGQGAFISIIQLNS